MRWDAASKNSPRPGQANATALFTTRWARQRARVAPGGVRGRGQRPPSCSYRGRRGSSRLRQWWRTGRHASLRAGRRTGPRSERSRSRPAPPRNGRVGRASTTASPARGPSAPGRTFPVPRMHVRAAGRARARPASGASSESRERRAPGGRWRARLRAFSFSRVTSRSASWSCPDLMASSIAARASGKVLSSEAISSAEHFC